MKVCAKPKEVNLIDLNLSKTNKYFDSAQIYDSQGSINMNWISTLIIGILFFSLKYLHPLRHSTGAMIHTTFVT